MMARYCDNDDCEGRFHTADCAAAQDATWPEDMAVATAREDGYGLPFIPRQPRRAA